MKLSYSFNIPYNKDIYNLCKVSKNLYNQALYIVKKELKENDNWLWYSDLDKIMKTTTNLEGNINYNLLIIIIDIKFINLFYIFSIINIH